ncbi:helix-turn-helix domain-containing protein [Halomonas sp. HK25]|uniref:helix-turn-helix domain-containing protein n=1 Tax=Halomonas sp. HK25 TaxID=3394321 RepID=UPI0039FCD7E8
MTQRIRALARGLQVVSAISGAETPLALVDLHRRTGIDKATLLRILATLEDEGWVYRGMSDQRYRLTCRIQALGESLDVDDSIAEIATPVLDALQKELIWPSDISVYDGEGMVIIETSRRRSPLIPNRELLGYHPSMLLSGIGRVYLAYSDARRREQILERIRRRGGHEAELASDRHYVENLVATVLEAGYALRDPVLGHFEAEEEVMGMAVPILAHGEIQASLSLVWLPALQAPDTAIPRFHRRLRQAAEALSTRFLEQGIY